MTSAVNERGGNDVDRRPLVLIVDDDEQYARRTASALSSSYRTKTALTGEAGLKRICEEIPAVVLLDQRMPGRLGGLAVLEEIKGMFPDVAVIMVSGYLDDDVMRGAMDRGAETCLTKNTDPAVLGRTIEREIRKALHFRRLEILERRDAQTAVEPVFESPAMRGIRERIDRIKDFPETILLTGPTGTGKSVLARWIHETSAFRAQPFEWLSLPGLNATLIQSELFGHEKGAFSGAATRRVGWLEKVNHGTIVLEEIGDLPLDLQPALLEVIATQTIKRVGGSETIALDVRIIACTNTDLDAAVSKGTFRRDLFARLKRHHIALPPLKERPEDIPGLVAQFVAAFSKRYKKHVTGIDPEAIRYLQGCEWPENLRGLEDVVGRAVLYAEGPILSTAHVAPTLTQDRAGGGSDGSDLTGGSALTYDEARLRWERSYVEDVLRATRGNVTEAATRMKIPRKGLYRKMKRFGIDADLFRARGNSRANS